MPGDVTEDLFCTASGIKALRAIPNEKTRF